MTRDQGSSPFTPNDPTNVDWDRVRPTKKRVQTCPKSVIAAIHKVIHKHGLPFYSAKLRGRYYVIGGYSGPDQQGFHATKVGCSKSISIHWSDSSPFAKREVMWQKERELRTILEAEGFVFEAPDRHWLRCDYHDDCDR